MFKRAKKVFSELLKTKKFSESLFMFQLFGLKNLKTNITIFKIIVICDIQ